MELLKTFFDRTWRFKNTCSEVNAVYFYTTPLNPRLSDSAEEFNNFLDF